MSNHDIIESENKTVVFNASDYTTQTKYETTNTTLSTEEYTIFALDENFILLFWGSVALIVCNVDNYVLETISFPEAGIYLPIELIGLEIVFNLNN